MAVTLRFRHILGPDGLACQREILVDPDGRIADVRPWDGRGAADGWLALPGLPNAHSHVFQSALSGYGEARAGRDSFWTWRDAMYRLANSLSPDDLAVIARLTFARMLRAGFTSVAEFHYLHRAGDAGPPEMARIVASAARESGIRLRLLPVLYQRGDIDREAAQTQRRFLHESVAAFARTLADLADLKPGIAVHSLRAVPPEALRDLLSEADHCLGTSVPLHIHAAEQRREVADCHARYGHGPIEMLDREIGLSDRWNVVHATHADAAERSRIVEAGATVVLCPLTEAYLGDGLFPVPAHIENGGAVAVGSDSNVRLDAVEELRMLEYGQRLADEARARLADGTGLGAALWHRLCEGGRRALRLPVGRLAAGSFADIVVVDPDHPALAGAAGPASVLDALVTAGDLSVCSAVYTGGRPVPDPCPELVADYGRRVRALMSQQP